MVGAGLRARIGIKLSEKAAFGGRKERQRRSSPLTRPLPIRGEESP